MKRKPITARNRILLIFDELSPPVSLLLVLAAQGYEVTLARNGEEVQNELVTDSKPDLVVLELQLNAIDLLQLIQSVQPHIPVIVTAEASLLNLALMIKEELGAWEVLPKPLDFTLLGQLLQLVMQKPAFIS